MKIRGHRAGARHFKSRRRVLQLAAALFLAAWFTYPAAASDPAVDQVGLQPSQNLPLYGSVQFNATVNVPGSQTIQSVVFQWSYAGATGPGTWTTFDTETSPTGTQPSPDGTSTYDQYTGTLDTTTQVPGDGNYDIQAYAVDGAGARVGTSYVLTDQTVANAENSSGSQIGDYIQLINPGSNLSGVTPLIAEPQPNAGHLPDTVTFWICKASDDCAASSEVPTTTTSSSQSGPWEAIARNVAPTTDSAGNPLDDVGNYSAPEFTTQLNTSKYPDGSYDLYVTGEDHSISGITPSDPFQGEQVSDVVIDNAPPTVSLQAPSGKLSGTAATLTATATAGTAGLSSVGFQVAPAGTNEWQTVGSTTSAQSNGSRYTFDLDTRQFTDGSYNIRATATDLAGNTSSSSTVQSVSISNPGSTPFSGLSVTDVDIPATNVTLLGELPGPEHETWAIGDTNAPAPTVLQGDYTASGDDQPVVLRYTVDTGWEIVDVLRYGPGNSANAPVGTPFKIIPGDETTVIGSMAPDGEAWVALCQSTGGSCSSYEMFQRKVNGQFLSDVSATRALGSLVSSPNGAPVNFSIKLSEDGVSGPVYGALIPNFASYIPSADQTTVWTAQGTTAAKVALGFGELKDGAWSVAGASLPTDYTAPNGVSTIKLGGAAVTASGKLWAAIEVDATNPLYSTSVGEGMILASYDYNGSAAWQFGSGTGFDALDATGPFSADSSQSLVDDAIPAVSPVEAGGATVVPTGIAADDDGGFVSAKIGSALGSTGSGTVVAQFDSSGAVVNSWCSTGVDALPWPSYDCAQTLDVNRPATAPQELSVDSTGTQAGVALSKSSDSLSVFEDGNWHTVPTPGFSALSASTTEVFADPTDGWISGANTMGLISASPPASPLASWPEANRDPLLSVALPPGQSTTDTAGALAVGLDGTALEYAPGPGWQVTTTPNQTHNLELTGVAYQSASLAFAVGQGGTILQWNGTTWSEDPASENLTHQGLNAVAFGSDGQGWAVGAYGTILHYDSGRWTSETIDAADAGKDITSVAVAGSEVYAVAGGDLIERNSDASWESVPSSAFSTVPQTGSLDLVSGLPDGGLVVAGKNLLLSSDSPEGGLKQAPESFNGIPVALSAFRDSSGNLRAYVSIAPPVESSNTIGGFPAGDGDLLLQTDSGWDDLSEDTPATTVSAPPGEGTAHPDPVLAVAASPDGSHAWAVGGYAGTLAADGVGVDQPLPSISQNWYSSSIWRYDAGGSVSSPSTAQSGVTLPAATGTVNFAYLSSAICAYQCSGAQDAQPFVNLHNAASEIAAYAQQPGGPAFTMFGGNAVGPVGAAGNGGVDLDQLPSLLAPLSGIPTYAAYGPLDGVSGFLDPGTPWAEEFADAPAPFGSGATPSGITPEGSGDPTGSVNKYYAFDVSQNGGALRVIVLDNSQGSLEASAPGQTQWLSGQLAAGQAAREPMVVFAAEPLDSNEQGSASDGGAVAAQLAAAGVLAVFTTAGGTTSLGTSTTTQVNQVNEVPADADVGAGGVQIPEYEGATMTYQQSQNNGVVWYDVSVNTTTDALTVNGVPVISALALEPLKGLSANRSSTLQFEAIGRRPTGTIAVDPITQQQVGYPQYVSIPGSSCSTCVTPSYTFTSSNPVVGNFVKATNASDPDSPESPVLSPSGAVTLSSKSGLFCAFNAGTTTVTVTTGLLSASETVTVAPGAYGPPCGTVPGGVSTDVINIAGGTVYESGGSAAGAAPVQPTSAGTQATVTPVIKVPVAPHVVHPHVGKAPVHITPPVHIQVVQPPAALPQPFIAPPSAFQNVSAAITPPIPPPITPVPPGGATAPAQSTAKREEKAKKEASQSAYVTRPAGESVEGWFYPTVGGVTILSLLLIAGGIRRGPKRAPAYARIQETSQRRRRHD